MADQGDSNNNPNEEQSRPLFQHVVSRAQSKLGQVSDHLKGKWARYDKADHIAFGCSGAVDPEVPYYDRLKHDLANTYCWSKSCCYDYIFFLANWHPLLGLFLSHPDHPWGKLERLQLLIVSLSLTIVPATFLAREQMEDGFLHQVPLQILKAYTIIFITIPDTIIGVVLYQLSIAETRCPSCLPILMCLRMLKNCCMCVVLTFAVLMSGLCILFLHTHDAKWGSVLPPLLFGKLYSYIIWLPLFTLLPCGLGFLSAWCSEKNAPPETNNEQPTPTENQGTGGNDA